MPRINMYVDLDIPEATDLADYNGIQNDLKTSKRFIELYNENYNSKSPIDRIDDALTTAIIIRYCRSFGGVRMKSWPGTAINLMSEPQRDLHRHIWEIRSKHIAHSVNNYEENRPQARYWNNEVHSNGFESISCSHVRVIGLGQSELVGLMEIINVLLGFLEKKIVEEQNKVLEIVNKMPVQKVLEFGNRPLGDLSNPQKSRANPKR